MRTIQFREALNEAMCEEMRRDPERLPHGRGGGGVRRRLQSEQGHAGRIRTEKRVIDTPIAELGFTAIAVGAAMNGLRPIVEFMTWNFAVLASDQIINHAAKMLQMSGGQFHVPITFRGGNGSAGQLAATHSQSFEAMYANVPGLKVITPSNPLRCQGPAEGRDPRQRPRALHGKRAHVRR
jgi:pyruvate dehydrogenase E1 component beta subunit